MNRRNSVALPERHRRRSQEGQWSEEESTAEVWSEQELSVRAPPKDPSLLTNRLKTLGQTDLYRIR